MTTRTAPARPASADTPARPVRARSRRQPPPLDLAGLLPSWELALRAERKSPATVKSYTEGVRRFLSWCDAEAVPPVLDRPTVTGFVVALMDAGAQPATAVSRQAAVRRFSAWLAEEGEQDVDLLVGLRRPRLDVKVVEPLTDEQVKRIIAACAGPAMYERRDEALVRLMVETGARAGEVVALTVEDVNLAEGRVLIRRGKGGKGRVVPIGPQTVRAIDRYLRARRAHRLADSPQLWLGDRGKGFSYDALHKALTGRAAAAEVSGFHPHLLRHTAAHRWLAAGGSEGGLMAVGGWATPDMMMRYTRARASDRAADEARTLGLGEW